MQGFLALHPSLACVCAPYVTLIKPSLHHTALAILHLLVALTAKEHACCMVHQAQTCDSISSKGCPSGQGAAPKHRGGMEAGLAPGAAARWAAAAAADSTSPAAGVPAETPGSAGACAPAQWCTYGCCMCSQKHTPLCRHYCTLTGDPHSDNGPQKLLLAGTSPDCLGGSTQGLTWRAACWVGRAPRGAIRGRRRSRLTMGLVRPHCIWYSSGRGGGSGSRARALILLQVVQQLVHELLVARQDVAELRARKQALQCQGSRCVCTAGSTVREHVRRVCLNGMAPTCM